jgi:hypothetical protein
MALLKKKRRLRNSYSLAEDTTTQTGFRGFLHQHKAALWKAFFIGSGVFVALLIALFLYVARDLPSSGNINKRFIAESTKIYDRSGQHILYPQ